MAFVDPEVYLCKWENISIEPLEMSLIKKSGSFLKIMQVFMTLNTK